MLGERSNNTAGWPLDMDGIGHHVLEVGLIEIANKIVVEFAHV